MSIEANRNFMKCPAFGRSMEESDQAKGVTPPSYERELTGEFVELPSFDGVITTTTYEDLLDLRRSLRVFADKAMSMSQLAFLLWSTQGIQNKRGPGTFRPVPSGGARHPFELFFVAKNVDGLSPGIYRYDPTKHIGEKRVTIEKVADLFDNYEETLNDMLVGQKWAIKAPVVVFVSCIPYRAEWRYTDASQRVQLIDLGHLGQNLMLSGTAMGLGSCNIAAFNQSRCDEILGFNGTDEYTVYALPIGYGKK